MMRDIPYWVQEKLPPIKSIKSDDKGNNLWERKMATQYNYYLFVKMEKRRRKIWIVKYYKKNDEYILIVKRDRAYHFHYKSKRYWFSDMFLRYLLERFWNIKVNLLEMDGSERVWSFFVMIQDILDNGVYLHFMKQWFEKQIFLKKDEMVLKKEI